MLFYDFWTGRWWPARALTASVLLHVAIFIFPLPHWRDAQAAEARRENERTQLTWFGPARDLPPLAPPAPRRGAAAKRETPAPSGRPTAIHPRQTIVSTPLRPNHPRQTLIQPQAPNLPPRILPPLPNIVQWSGPTSPAPRPRPIVQPLDVRRARRARAQRPAEELPLPAVPNSEARAGELNIASTLPVNQRPRLPVVPMSVPNAGTRRAGAEAGAAPDIPGVPAIAGAAGDGLRNLIALSPDPAPPAPDLEIPLGNLSARFAAAPSLQGSGDGIGGGSGAGPGGSGPGSGGTGNGDGGGGSGPPGISISGGNPENAGRVAGPGGSAPMPSRPLPARPQPRPSGTGSDLRLPSAGPLRVEPRSTPSLGPAYPSAPLEPADAVFGTRRIYTLHVNMPNLTSAAGSWILRFAELNPDGESSPVDLSAPSPVRKVDPRYPPVLIEQRIEGEVRLYAIIRADGTVDSVQVLRSVHPDLDRYSMEALVKWRFRPAGRNGKPVDVEAVVSIPFRLSAPL